MRQIQINLDITKQNDVQAYYDPSDEPVAETPFKFEVQHVLWRAASKYFALRNYQILFNISRLRSMTFQQRHWRKWFSKKWSTSRGQVVDSSGRSTAFDQRGQISAFSSKLYSQSLHLVHILIFPLQFIQNQDWTTLFQVASSCVNILKSLFPLKYFSIWCILWAPAL